MNIIMDAMRERGSLEQLISRCLIRLRGDGAGSKGGDFVQQMTAYVDAHYMDESLSLQFIADRVVYMNADYIGREFTRAIGRKFSSYLLETRMEHAKLLMAGEPSMHSYEIAEKEKKKKNPHYFSQLFRKYTGQTPKDYRRWLQDESSPL